MTITALLTNMTAFYTFMIAQLTNIIDMIIANPLVYTPVLIALLGGIIMFVIHLVKRLGISGVSSSGKKRRGYR